MNIRELYENIVENKIVYANTMFDGDGDPYYQFFTTNNNNIWECRKDSISFTIYPTGVSQRIECTKEQLENVYECVEDLVRRFYALERSRHHMTWMLRGYIND